MQLLHYKLISNWPETNKPTSIRTNRGTSIRCKKISEVNRPKDVVHYGSIVGLKLKEKLAIVIVWKMRICQSAYMLSQSA